jgi:hypothetical protein
MKSAEDKLIELVLSEMNELDEGVFRDIFMKPKKVEPIVSRDKAVERSFERQREISKLPSDDEVSDVPQASIEKQKQWQIGGERDPEEFPADSRILKKALQKQSQKDLPGEEVDSALQAATAAQEKSDEVKVPPLTELIEQYQMQTAKRYHALVRKLKDIEEAIRDRDDIPLDDNILGMDNLYSLLAQINKQIYDKKVVNEAAPLTHSRKQIHKIVENLDAANAAMNDLEALLEEWVTQHNVELDKKWTMRYNRFKNSLTAFANKLKQKVEEPESATEGPTEEEIEADKGLIDRLGWYAVMGNKIAIKVRTALKFIEKKRGLQPEPQPQEKDVSEAKAKPIKYSEIKENYDEFMKLMKIANLIVKSEEPTTIMQVFNKSQQSGSELKMKNVTPGQIENGTEFLAYFRKMVNNLADQIGGDPDIETEKDIMALNDRLAAKIKALQAEYAKLVPEGTMTQQQVKDIQRALIKSKKAFAPNIPDLKKSPEEDPEFQEIWNSTEQAIANYLIHDVEGTKGIDDVNEEENKKPKKLSTALGVLKGLNIFVNQFVKLAGVGSLKRENFAKLTGQFSRFVTHDELLPLVKAIQDWESLIAAYEKALQMAKKEIKDAPATDEDKFNELKAKTEKVIDNIIQYVRPIANDVEDAPDAELFYTSKALALAEDEEKEETTAQIFKKVLQTAKKLESNFGIAQEKDGQSQNAGSSIDDRISAFYTTLYGRKAGFESFAEIENQWKLSFNKLFAKQKKQIKKAEKPKETPSSPRRPQIEPLVRKIAQDEKEKNPEITVQQLKTFITDIITSHPSREGSGTSKETKELIKKIVNDLNDKLPDDREVQENPTDPPTAPETEQAVEDAVEKILEIPPPRRQRSHWDNVKNAFDFLIPDNLAAWEASPERDKRKIVNKVKQLEDGGGINDSMRRVLKPDKLEVYDKIRNPSGQPSGTGKDEPEKEQDTDGDGIPDKDEKIVGLDPENPDDGKDVKKDREGMQSYYVKPIPKESNPSSEQEESAVERTKHLIKKLSIPEELTEKEAPKVKKRKPRLSDDREKSEKVIKSLEKKLARFEKVKGEKTPENRLAFNNLMKYMQWWTKKEFGAHTKDISFKGLDSKHHPPLSTLEERLAEAILAAVKIYIRKRNG